MKVIDGMQTVFVVVGIIFCGLWSVKLHNSWGFLSLAQGLLVNCGNTDASVCVSVCVWLLEVRLLLCPSAFFRLQRTLHLLLSVSNTHTDIQYKSHSFVTSLTAAFNGKICLHCMRHKSEYFQQEWHKHACLSVCFCLCMCVCVFLHRLWVNKCGFMIRAHTLFSEGKRRRKRKFKGILV